MKFIDDYLVSKDNSEMKWIGIWIKTDNYCLVILNEFVHDWLIPFHDFYIGFK